MQKTAGPKKFSFYLISRIDGSQNVKTYECLTLQLLDTVQHIQNMQYQGIPMLQTQEIALKTSFFTF